MNTPSLTLGAPIRALSVSEGLLRLEEQAQRKLDISHVARLTGDLTECGKVGRVEAGAVPVRVVEDVERLGAELHAGLLRERELLEETDVPVHEARVVDHVPESCRLRVERVLGGLGEEQIPAGNRGLEPVLGFGAAIGRNIVNDGRRRI